MKLYVCYWYYQYEGCSAPIVVFDTEEKAQNWCVDDENKEYETLELNKE